MSRDFTRQRRTGTSHLLADRHRSLVGRKSTPQRLKAIIKCVAEMPVIVEVCRRTGCSRNGLDYWLSKSETGKPGDGFDVATSDLDESGNPITRRFHECFIDALKDGIDSAEKAAWKLVHGQPEVLTHKGHVQYQVNPAATALGLIPGDREYYLLDEFGRPMPETILKQDPDMIRFMLKAHRPDVYVPGQKIDVTHRGGVLILTAPVKTSKEFDENIPNKLNSIQDVEFEEVDDNTEGAK